MKLEVKIVIGLLSVLTAVMIIGVSRMGGPSRTIERANSSAGPSKAELLANYQATLAEYERAVEAEQKAEKYRNQYRDIGGENPQTIENFDNSLARAREARQALEREKDRALDRASR